MNDINNNREDDIKTEGGEIIGNIPYRYIGDEYKDFVDITFTI